MFSHWLKDKLIEFYDSERVRLEEPRLSEIIRRFGRDLGTVKKLKYLLFQKYSRQLQDYRIHANDEIVVGLLCLFYGRFAPSDLSRDKIDKVIRFYDGKSIEKLSKVVYS